MRLNLFCVAASVLVHFGCAAPLAYEVHPQGMRYLIRYGYLDPATFGPEEMPSSSQMENAFQEFQKMANIPTTGQMDDATGAMMAKPRCGMKDNAPASSTLSEFVLVGSSWPSTSITYKIVQYSNGQPPAIINSEMYLGFKIWSEQSPLIFEATTGSADIDIAFVTRAHGDNSPFDGPFGVLAHAFFPTVGDVHYDDEEYWSVVERGGIQLLQVAVHEFGHSLGLAHSANPNAIMAPFYNGFLNNVVLHQDDIDGIQALYGPPPIVILPPITNDICNDATIDAITTTSDGTTYAFAGDYYYVIDSVNTPDARSTQDDWGIAGPIDAAFTSTTGRTYIFKGDTYWKFFNMFPFANYPRLIFTRFTNIPQDFSAVFRWTGDNGYYFFKDDMYYVQGLLPAGRVDLPRPITDWANFQNPITAAFAYTDGITYFFSGDQFYAYDDVMGEVSPGFPQNVATVWFNCAP